MSSTSRVAAMENTPSLKASIREEPSDRGTCRRLSRLSAVLVGGGGLQVAGGGAQVVEGLLDGGCRVAWRGARPQVADGAVEVVEGAADRVDLGRQLVGLGVLEALHVVADVADHALDVVDARVRQVEVLQLVDVRVQLRLGV